MLLLRLLGVLGTSAGLRNAALASGLHVLRLVGKGALGVPAPLRCPALLHLALLLALSARSAGPAMNDRNGHHGLWVQGSSNVLMTK